MWLSFLHASVNLNFSEVLLFTPLLLPLQCHFFSCISHSLGMKYGTVNVSTKNMKYCGRKCFSLAKDGTFPQSPSGELWIENIGWRRKSECGHGGESDGGGGGWGKEKNWKKRCQLIKHVHRLRVRKGIRKKKGKKKFFSPGPRRSQPGHGRSLLASCRATILCSVNTSTQHVITDNSVKTNKV